MKFTSLLSLALPLPSSDSHLPSQLLKIQLRITVRISAGVKITCNALQVGDAAAPLPNSAEFATKERPELAPF
ncbi:hypothetical protein BDQ17DRAFT_1379563, partial [Cyathus striatus]